jgi:hypothetical protein
MGLGDDVHSFVIVGTVLPSFCERSREVYWCQWSLYGRIERRSHSWVFVDRGFKISCVVPACSSGL